MADEESSPSSSLEAALANHPAADQLRQLFRQEPLAVGVDFVATGRSRKHYLAVIAGNIDFFRQHQDEHGAIIDPYEGRERQYSTPCFAYAAALLVDQAGRADLLEPASRALTFAIDALVNRTAADRHPDFYAPPVMHAMRLLKGHVAPEVYQSWAEKVRQLVPEETYVAIGGEGNWSTVNVSGEALRRKDGLVAQELQAAQAEYIERILARQAALHYTRFGLYEDGAIVPMAYDAFPRLWLEEIVADDAYHGPQRERLEQFLTMGGFSTLLLLSPSGEWASGGRSSHHQWNEAQVAAICEMNANRWKALGRDDVAATFKRAARLALGSVQRWVRPSGELWIVKNRADPQLRHGYEGYSFHSQYNLLAMAMLALAYEHADESIGERPIPSEAGGYVFDVRETFYKVAAAAGGYYVLIDTASDQHYNSTGLQRVHHRDVAFSAVSDTTAEHRWYAPREETPLPALSPTIQWREPGDEQWFSLANFRRFKPGNDRHGNPLPIPAHYVKDVTLETTEASSQRVTFAITYHLSHRGRDIDVLERYVLAEEGVSVNCSVSGLYEQAEARVLLPALVSDGDADTQVQVDGGSVMIKTAGGVLEYSVLHPAGMSFELEGPRVPVHIGFVRAAVAPLNVENARPSANWVFRLRPAPAD